MMENSNNKVIIIKEDGRKTENIHGVEGLTIRFHGSNNYIEISEPCNFWNSVIESQDNLEVKIGRNSKINNLVIQKMWGSVRPYPKSVVNIGDAFSCTGVQMFVSPDEGNITIGKDVMFSFGIIMAISDAHIIKNKRNGKIINRNRDIIIEDHVWIGMNATILKGTKIMEGSVVGANTVVSGRFKERNIIIAGNPGRKIKNGIEWSRENYGEYIRG
jgi:acetyltransferase-like isoleucine patch superfamily enzyme